MHRTEGSNYQEIAGKKYFSNGPPGTLVEEDWLNAVQEEIAYVIEQAGLTLETASTESRQQLIEGIQKFTRAYDQVMASGVGLDFSAASKGKFRGLEAVVYRIKNVTIINGDDPLGATGGEWELADDTSAESYLGPSGTSLIEENYGGAGGGIFAMKQTGYFLILGRFHVYDVVNPNYYGITLHTNLSGAGYLQIAGGTASNANTTYAYQGIPVIALIKVTGVATNTLLKWVFNPSVATGSLEGSESFTMSGFAIIKLADI